MADVGVTRGGSATLRGPQPAAGLPATVTIAAEDDFGIRAEKRAAFKSNTAASLPGLRCVADSGRARAAACAL